MGPFSRIALAASLALAGSCASASDAPPRTGVAPPVGTRPAAIHPASAPAAQAPSRPSRAAPIEPTITIERLPDGSTYLLHQFRIDLDTADLDIVDLAMTKTLADALETEDSSLVFNGGFFSPTTAPEGLAICRSRELSALDVELGGGVVAIGRTRMAALYDVAGFVTPAETDFAIQCRPRLIVEGAPNIRSDDGRRADRTVLCLRDGGHTLDVLVARTDDLTGMGGPTLFELSRLLRGRGCRNALNLDGGPSTGVAWRERGGVRALPSRGPVRHGISVRLSRAR